MREFEKLAQHLFICAPSVAQHAALACFLAGQPEDPRSSAGANSSAGAISCVPALERAGLAVPAQPAGAFYVYARCPADARGRQALRAATCWSAKASRRRRASISARTQTKRYVRFAYTRAMADLEEAARRLASVLRAR